MIGFFCLFYVARTHGVPVPLTETLSYLWLAELLVENLALYGMVGRALLKGYRR